MPLNKVGPRSDMYDWITHTWNTVKGKCPHNCSYCYMKRWEQNFIRFDEKELKTKLGAGNTIFVGSSCDMFADSLTSVWVHKTLEHCNKYPDNTYVFQTKNPGNFQMFGPYFPDNIILGTTIESDIVGKNSGTAPSPENRSDQMWRIKSMAFKTFVTIEPIMEFNYDPFIKLIKNAEPDFVNIGANSLSYQRRLPEPSSRKLKDLISNLSEFTEVKLKKNLKRLL